MSKKPKKNIKQVFSNLNSSKDIERGKEKVNKKDKRVVWFFGAGLLTTLTLGIVLPLTLTYNQVVNKEPINGDLSVGGGLEGELPSIDDVIGENTSTNRTNSLISEYESMWTQYNYVLERQAFLKLKAFMDETKFKNTSEKMGSTSYGVDVSRPLEDVKEAQRKQLDADRKSYIAANPGTWTEGWKNELLTNEKYGNLSASNETNISPIESIDYIESLVVNYLTSESIKSAAFAQYQSAEVSTKLWTNADLDLSSPSLIKYDQITPKININDDGTWKVEEISSDTKGEIAANNKFLNDYFKTSSGVNGSNVFVDPNNNKPNDFVAVLETDSYIPEFRNPINNFSDLLSNNFQTSSISSIDLGIFLKDKKWNFNIDLLKKLLSLYEYNNSGTRQVGMVINDLQSYQGAQNIINGDPSKNEIEKGINKDLALVGKMTETTTDPEGEGDGQNPETKSFQNTKTLTELGGGTLTKNSELLKAEENTSRFFNLVALTSGENTNTDPLMNTNLYNVKKENPLNKILNKIVEIGMQPTYQGAMYEGLGFLSNLIRANFHVVFDSSTNEVKSIDFSTMLVNGQPNYPTDANLLKWNTDGSIIKFNDLLNNIPYPEATFNTDFLSNSPAKSGIIVDAFEDSAERKGNKFADENNYMNPRKWTVYELNPNTYMYVGDTGSKIFSITKINNSAIGKTNMIKMIENEIQSTYYSSISSGGSEGDSTTKNISNPAWKSQNYFNPLNLYSQINSDNFINNINYNTTSISQDSPNAKWEEILKIKFTDEADFNNEQKYIKRKLYSQSYLTISNENLASSQGLGELINNQINLNNSFDYFKEYTGGALQTGNAYYLFNNSATFDPLRGKENQFLEELDDRVSNVLYVPYKEEGGK